MPIVGWEEKHPWLHARLLERPEASKALNRLGVDAYAVMETGSSAEIWDSLDKNDILDWLVVWNIFYFSIYWE